MPRGLVDGRVDSRIRDAVTASRALDPPLPARLQAILGQAYADACEDAHPARPADPRGRPYETWRAEERANAELAELDRIMREPPAGRLGGG